MLENLPSFLTRWDDGEIVLTGHRIGLYTIVRDHLEHAMSAAEIQDYYPTLEPGLVEQVLAFYRERQPEVYEFYSWTVTLLSVRSRPRWWESSGVS